MANIRAAWKFTRFLLWSALLIPPQMLVMLFTNGDSTYVIPSFWQKRICRVFGLDVEVVNAPVQSRPAVFVSNHVSYLDIPVIASVLPVSFVAKAEVANWPLFGLLARLQQTVFVSRSRAAVGREKDALAATLANGKRLVIFPEGTSSDGSKALPFKSSLLGIALEAGGEMPIQPFTIELAEIGGRKIAGQQDRDFYAWYGDMTLMPHFWNFAKTSGAKVRLHFHAPLHVKEIQDRKILAQKCHELVASALTNRMAETA